MQVLNNTIYILDVSSHPHGVDFKSANELNLKNKLLLGIPGDVAPKTAGNILVKKINSVITSYSIHYTKLYDKILILNPAFCKSNNLVKLTKWPKWIGPEVSYPQ